MHETVYQDIIGVSDRASGPLLQGCGEIPEELNSALQERLGVDCRLTPIQAQAVEAGICGRNSHFIVSAPTNSGKTLVALFRVFSDLILKRGRCVYVAPLKALAEEKKADLEALSQLVASCGGPKIRLVITTGDYQLTGDFLGSPPPADGELIICTPERLEILLRSKDSIFWARTVSTFVLDEFHLLGDGHRGATMEILVTRILASCPWSRILALSASIGGLIPVADWLGVTGTPVRILENDWRCPVLNRTVISTDDKWSYVKETAEAVLESGQRTLLIFAAQKREAESMSRNLQKEFPLHKKAISYLHAGLTIKQRSERLEFLLAGKHRILIATTALKMGIDAPVTDVLVHDVSLWNSNGRSLLTYADLLQMTGRAGRRNTPGNAVILCDSEQAGFIVDRFRSAEVEPLSPQLFKNGISKKAVAFTPDPVLSVLLSEIVMQERTTDSHLDKYLSHTFSALIVGSMICLRQVNELIRLKLAYRSEEEPDFIFPTKLGKTVSQTGLSPESGSMMAGFLRALIHLDENYEKKTGRHFNYLRRLTDLDLIFICCACYECRDAWLRAPSKRAVADVQEFLESLSPEEKPIVNLWQEEASLEYPTRRLLTSLRIPFEADKPGNAEKVFFRMMQTAVLLYQHGRGIPLAGLAVKFKAAIGELENHLKFSVLWTLGCLSQICNGRRCYKFNFLSMRAIKLIECISVGSELGELLTIKGVGRKSIERLIENGPMSLDDLVDYTVPELIGLGLKERQAVLICNQMPKNFR